MLGVSAEKLHASSIGIALGVASSVTTAVHAIIVKRSLPIVDGSTLDLVYYSNLLSAGVIVPFVLVSGEAWVVLEMVAGTGAKPEALGTFLWGAAITVSAVFAVKRGMELIRRVTGCLWIPHLPRWVCEYQGDVAHLAHGLCRRVFAV